MKSASLKVVILALLVSLILSNEIFTSQPWIMVATGGSHFVGLTANNKIYAWGNNMQGQIGIPVEKWRAQREPNPVMHQENFKFVAAGGFTSFAITNDGKLYGWGNNLNHQLGISSNIQETEKPTRVGDKSNWASVAVGRSHTLALDIDGKLYGWGHGFNGKNGNAEGKEVNTPTLIFPSHTWSFIAAGDDHSFGITRDHELFAWGGNKFGQLGDGTTVDKFKETRIGGESTTFMTVSAGRDHTLAIDTSGKIYAWGNNDHGQAGALKSQVMVKIPQTPEVWKTTKFQAVSAGTGFSLVIKDDYTTWGFGANSAGQLGTDKKEDHFTPAPAFKGVQMSSVSAGFEAAFGVTRKGTIFGWGSDNSGALGGSKPPQEKEKTLMDKLFRLLRAIQRKA